MINDADVEFWQKFARSWVLIDDAQEDIRQNLESYNYTSLVQETMDYLDDDDDDDID